MTDITRLLASLKRRSAHAKDFGDDVTFVKLEDIDALVEAMEKAQAQSSKWLEGATKPYRLVLVLRSASRARVPNRRSANRPSEDVNG